MGPPFQFNHTVIFGKFFLHLSFSFLTHTWRMKEKKNFPHYGMVSKIKLSDAYRKIQTTPGI